MQRNWNFKFWKKENAEKKEEKINQDPPFVERVAQEIGEYGGTILPRQYENLSAPPIIIVIENDAINISFLPKAGSQAHRDVDFKHGVDFQAQYKKFTLNITSPDFDQNGNLTNPFAAGNLELRDSRDAANFELFKRTYSTEWGIVDGISQTQAGQVLALYDIAHNIRRNLEP